MFAQIFCQVLCCHNNRLFSLLLTLFQNRPGLLPADRTNLSLQSTHSGFSRIITYDIFQCVILYLKFLLADTVFDKLFLYQMFFCNMKLFICGVAADLDQFHPVKQRPRNPFRAVRRGNKKYLRQIKRNLHIMIPESIVLLSIQHLQKCRRGISLIIGCQLVNFIQKEQRILHPCLSERICDPSRHSSHIRLSVSPYLCLIPHTAKTDSHIFLVQCRRHALCDRSLTGSRRSYQTDNRTLSLAAQYPYCQILQHTFLHLLQSVVIGIQDLFCLFQIRTVFGCLIPR